MSYILIVRFLLNSLTLLVLRLQHGKHASENRHVLPVGIPCAFSGISLGLKTGVRASDDLSGFSLRSTESKRPTFGPMVDVRLPWRTAVELDVLYRAVGYTSTYSSWAGSGITRERSNSWEFPLIANIVFPPP